MNAEAARRLLLSEKGRKSMFEKFYPDSYVESAYVIDYEGLYKKGYRGIIFDIDMFYAAF